MQDNNTTTAPEVVETTIDGPSQEWFSAHRTTPEEQASATWAADRTRDIAASKAIKQALGQGSEAYSKQLASLNSDELSELSEMNADEIAVQLDARAEADRDLKRLEKQAKEQAEENFEHAETPEQRQVRKSMKTVYKEVASLDKRIAELQKLNDLRDDPSAEGWDDLSAEQWRQAREGNMESFGMDIANLIQAKQAKLQEAALHQNAYYEVSRAHSVPDRPIGQIIGNDGRPMQVTQADISTMVQLERDAQAHAERTNEAKKHYSDWDQVAMKAAAAGVDVGAREAAFIQSLPNSADVVYYLASHPQETIALGRMSGHEATRALINISHNTTRRSTSEASRRTSAPKPPSPVSGSSRGDFNVNDESGSADEWMHKRNAELRRRGKSY